MTAITFNTIENIKKFRQADFTQTQAETAAEVIEQQSQIIHDQQIELETLKSIKIATKEDIRESELKLQKEIAEVKKDIAQIESRLIKWVFMVELGASTLICGATFTMLKLMLH